MVRDALAVRTTLDLDSDVLAAARSLAKVRRASVGQVVSDLARNGLQAHVGTARRTRNGVPLFSRSSSETLVTLELVNDLRDETP